MISRKRAVFFAVLYYSEETMPIFKSLKFPSMTNILYTTPQNIQFNNMGEPYIEYDEDYEDLPDDQKHLPGESMWKKRLAEEGGGSDEDEDDLDLDEDGDDSDEDDDEEGQEIYDESEDVNL